MDEQQKLDLNFVKSLMEESYTLVWVDGRDNLDGHHDLIGRCMNEHSACALWDEVNRMYEEVQREAVKRIIGEVKGDCMKAGFDKETVGAFFEENDDAIKEIIYDRDDSDPLNDLLRQTGDLPVRVEMLSNYDCINSHWLESQGGYCYPGSYFGDMIDALNLNPAKVKQYLAEQGETLDGHYPDEELRNGNEQVSYEDFYNELLNSCCGANLLTYIGTVNLKELYDAGFVLEKITIPQGNCCGIFSSMQGGGSLLEMELKKDVTLDLKVENYHGFRLKLDNEHSKYDYSIKHVYGVCDSFFGDSLKIIA